MAGTAHADAYIGLGTVDDGSGAAGLQGLNAMLSPPTRTGCGSPINTGQAHYVLDTAQYALNRWVTTGIPLPFSWPRNGAPGPRVRYGCVPPVEGDDLGGVAAGLRGTA